MKHLSIKILFMCLFACVCAFSVSAQCGDEKKLKDSFESQKKFAEKKNDDAVKSANKGVEKNPTCFYAYFMRGKLSFDLGKFNEAVADLKKTEELIPQETNAIWQPKIAEAKTFLDENFSKVYLKSCYSYGKEKKIQLAYNDCLEATKRSKNSISDTASPFAYYANLLNRPDMAVWAYTLIINADEQRNEYYTGNYEMRGRYRYLNGKFDLAAEDFKKAGEIRGYRQKYVSLEIKANETARSGFVRIINKDLTEEIIKADQAKMDSVDARLEQGKQAEVLSDLNEILKRRPHLGQANFLRGKAYLKNNNEVDKAIEDLTLAVKLEPWKSDYHYYLAEAYDSIYTKNRSKQKCIDEATQVIYLDGDFLKQAYFKRAGCESDPILAHSDFLNSKWQDEKTRSIDSTMDSALENYSANNACPAMTNGTAISYFERARDFLKNSNDLLCAISDYNRSLSLRTSQKGEIYYARGLAYRLLTFVNISKSISKDYNFPFYTRASRDLTDAINAGNLSAVNKSISYLNLCEISRIEADEFYDGWDFKALLLRSAIVNYENAVPNVDPTFKVKVLTGSFFARIELAEVLMPELQKRINKSDQTQQTTNLIGELNLLVEKIYAQQKTLNQSSDTANEIKEAFAEFNAEYEKFKKL